MAVGVRIKDLVNKIAGLKVVVSRSASGSQIHLGAQIFRGRMFNEGLVEVGRRRALGPRRSP